MKRKWTFVSVLLGVLLLTVGVGLSQAQEPPPPDDDLSAVEVDAEVMNDVIPIQGRLTDASGNPVPNGNYSITASIYDVFEFGVTRCTDVDEVAVTNGLFNMDMDFCTALDINGDQLYLGIKVGADAEMTPRQVINAVPYAWNLRPGAIISAATIWTKGDVSQSATGDGLVKAAVYAKCTNVEADAKAARSFNNVTEAWVTITKGAAVGQCTLDFGFDISSRYWIPTVTGTTGPYYVVCKLDIDNNNQLNCYVWDKTGAGANGYIIVTMY